MNTAAERFRRKLSTVVPVDEQGWRKHARCKYETSKDWFSSNVKERYEVRAICISECPVRKQCLQYALDTMQLDGIWGGVDEYNIRRTLSVNAKGERTTRARGPRCPFCQSKNLTVNCETQRVECPCGLSWPYVAR